MAIRAVMRALAVFDCFSQKQPKLSLHEISEKLELAKSTTFRLVGTLVETGYLIQLEDQRYCISMKLLRLGGLVQSTLNVRDIAVPEMREINSSTGETVVLTVLAGEQRTALEVLESVSPLKLVFQVGDTVSLRIGAVGRVFLAHHPEINVDNVFKDKSEKNSINPPTTAELNKIRAQGFDYLAGTRAPGAASVAVPIFDINDMNTHCLSIAGPESRILENKQPFIELIRAAAARISTQLGSAALPVIPTE
ncbi:MAG: IclR family transcriptional regulator [Rhodospirillaceae bacterium]|jgi:DNA-binding IclR family transcriptional regulator|nr:IclR family transcriptional regulator [Rhodospirillaceae bacterium]MBT3911001.1 IclR family transcriptional regulator [Rhodospirillaceae bacterium]MBT5297021.1 IclR family transcriptional regulator [Rhodospirillaceae bacterium]MBT5516249.1 IclR family transcriptional regulator [Rhodospirillaceae bacterium]MBT6085270.1 IclR family transcriptional regulator [Rhodospirillaceae bacterium]